MTTRIASEIAFAQRNLPILGGCFLLLSALFVPDQCLAEPLHSPYAEAPGLRHQTKPLDNCPASPTPLRDLAIESIFVPGKWNDKVPERVAAREAATKPLHEYLARLATMANAAMQQKGELGQANRECVLRWMTEWAQGGALLGEVSWPEGHYERKWSLIALAEMYLELYAGDANPPPPPQPVAQWLHAMAEPLPRQYPESAWSKNNHFYWAGLAGVVVGTVLKDSALYDWGAHRIAKGLDDVDADGYLPLELKRGSFALVYHAVSASPLVQAAAFMQANGTKPLELNGGALQRLVRRIFNGLADPSGFEGKAGAMQSPLSRGDQNSLGWVELYYRMTGDAQAEPWIRALRPFNTIWLGGNFSDAFGLPLASGPVGQSKLIVRSN